MSQFLAEFRKKFAPFPTPPVKDDKGFNTYLGECIDRFRVEATNAGVQLPPEFGFSFSSLRGKLNYPPGHIALWMRQLQEISAILNILYNAKINYLWNLCRVPAQGEDGGGDCLLQTATVTNQWGVVTPYKITFRGFSSEVAAVMEGFARSSNCFIIKTIDVSPDLSVQPIAVQTPAQSAAPAYAAPPRNPSPVRNQSDHHRGPPEMRPPPGAAPQEPSAPATAAAVTAPPVLFLSENALLVTISVDVVKLKASDR